MSFFGSLMKGLGDATQNAAIKGIALSWEKIRSISPDRLEEIYKERRESNQYDIVGALAILALYRNAPYSSVSAVGNEERWKRTINGIKRTIELENGREFEEIREAIRNFEKG
ncbi:hypothetical protein [Methylomicrobium agile]|uniref:hypothetical protein n=1 Tax=Methylomicrobium agile TaxID=39774 RepID=UPI0004DF41B2|nr:hypothetical protein [Methylomicrobium agile]